MKCFYKRRGSLTIFVSLILTLVIIFTTILIDASKIIYTRNLVAGAGDLTLSAGLSSYNTILLDTYGLFANSKDEAELANNLRKYFEETLKHQSINDSDVVNALTSLAMDGKATNLFDISVDEFKISGTEGANLSNYRVLKSEILQYSKYRAPVSMGYGFLEKLNVLKSLKEQNDVLDKKKQYEKKLKEIEDLCLEIYAGELALQSYAKGQADKSIFDKSPEEIVKLSSSEIITSVLKDSFRLKTEVLRLQAGDFYEANRNLVALAFVEVEEKLPKGATWEDKIERDEVLGYTDIEQIKNDLDNHTGKLGSLYTDLVNIKSDLSGDIDAYLSLDATLNYFEDYKKSVDIFRDVDYLYKKKIKELDERIDELNEIIANPGTHEAMDGDGNPITEENDTSSEEAERDELIDKKEELSSWYGGYKRLAKEYDMEELRKYFIERAKLQFSNYALKATALVRSEHTWFDIYEEEANKVKELLEKLKIDSENLRRIKEEWGNGIKGLSESSIKSNMQNDYKSKTDVLLDEYIETNIKIVNNILNYAREAKRDLANIKYKGTSLVESDINVDKVIEYMNYRIYSEKDTIIRSSQHLYNYVDEKIYADSAFTDSFVLAYGGKAYKQAEVDLPYLGDGRLYILGIEALEKEFGNTYPAPTALNNLVFERENIPEDSKDKTDNLYKILKKMTSRILDIDQDAKKEQERKRDEVLKNETSLQNDNARQISSDIVENIMSQNPEVSKALETNFGKDSKNIADNVIKESGKALDGFEKLKDIALKGRDSLYLTEYATQMFSAYTTSFKDGKETGEEELTLSGIALNTQNNAVYRAEQEYILLGKKNPKVNVDGVRNRIFAIRALLNLIYAYTGNSKLETETFTMATTIAGWTGFGVPIVQNVLKVIAAVVESTYDTKDLMDGYSITVYKSMPTWKFYYTSVFTDAVKDLGSGAISEMVNTASSKLKGNSDALIDATSAYVEGSIENITESIILYFQKPIQELLLRAISNAEADTNKSLEESKKIIRQGFENLKQELNEQKQKLVGVDGASPLVIEAKLKVLEVFNTDDSVDALANMANEIIQAEQNEISNVSKGLEDKVKSYFESRKTKILDNINSVINVKELKEEIKEDINGAIQEGGELVQAKLNKALNKFADKLDGSIPKDADKLSEFDSNRAALLSMNYKEYLKVFILIQTLVNDKVVVERMGNLIQKNATKAGAEYFISDSFELRKSKTMLSLEAKIGIKPSFLNLDFKDYGINNDYFKDISRYKIKYKEVLGY